MVNFQLTVFKKLDKLFFHLSIFFVDAYHSCVLRNKSVALGDQVTPLRREQARDKAQAKNIPPRRRMQRGQDGLRSMGQGTACLFLEKQYDVIKTGLEQGKGVI